MYPFTQPRTELTRAKLVELATRFESLRDIAGLAVLLDTPPSQLERLAANPVYHTFKIPKPGGAKRVIDHPAPALKAVQQRLNRYLQAVYHGVKPASAYGFIVRAQDEGERDGGLRNIYTNALQHVKSEWFLQVDIADFFHAVTLSHLRDLFRQVFFFPPDLTRLLCALTTYSPAGKKSGAGRLPMGAPTSPVLANLACLFLDYELEVLAAAHRAVYTRYADDLTFSFAAPPPAEFLENVRFALLHRGFRVNEKKLRLQARLEQPEITGLVLGLGHKPTLSKARLKRLRRELRLYRWLLHDAAAERGWLHAGLLDKMRQSLAGEIAFVGFVLGREHKDYRRLAGAIKLVKEGVESEVESNVVNLRHTELQ